MSRAGAGDRASAWTGRGAVWWQGTICIGAMEAEAAEWANVSPIHRHGLTLALSNNGLGSEWATVL